MSREGQLKPGQDRACKIFLIQLFKWNEEGGFLHVLIRSVHLHFSQSEHRLWSLQNKRVDTFCNYPAELVCWASLHSTVHTLRVFPIKMNKTFEDSNTSSIIDNIRVKFRIGLAIDRSARWNRLRSLFHSVQPNGKVAKKNMVIGAKLYGVR